MHGFCLTVYMKLFLTIILSALSTVAALAQGNVEVISDPDVDALETARIERRKSNNGRVQGYRIMIAFYSSREAANDKLAEVRSWFGSTYGAVLLYDEPNFKVYSGEFTSKVDAESALLDIRKRYPGARIVGDLVNPPRVH